MNLKVIPLPDGNIVLANESENVTEPFIPFVYDNGKEWVETAFTEQTFSARDEDDKLYPILYQTQDKIPGIPLVKEADLRVQERYKIEVVPEDDDMLSNEYHISQDNKFVAMLYNEQIAQDYCNYLNRKERSVDVEELALKMYCDKYDFHTVKDTPDGKRILARSEYIEGVKDGYNASPKGGWNDEDIRKAINFGADIEAGNIKTDFKKYPTYKDQFIASLSQAKLNEYVEIEMKDGMPVMEGNYVKVKA